MKHRVLHALAMLVASAALYSCSSPDWDSSARGNDFISPRNGTSVDGIPADPGQFSNGVTNGIRTGDQAINRNNIDALLNNPNRTAPRQAESRPGLATGWGKEKKSVFSNQSFVRASSQPAGTDVIYYNDKKGLEAMAPDKSRVEGLQTAAGGLVEWGIKGNLGFLATYKSGYYATGRRLVSGDAESTYKIVVRNRCKSSLEIIASVDGLDVIDGKRASFSKKGHVVNPGQTIEIEGFRTSMSTVAAFKFSSVPNSYANMRHGETRNVGVIGLAVFTQKGVSPWTWMPREINQRDTANPFASAPKN